MSPRSSLASIVAAVLTFPVGRIILSVVIIVGCAALGYHLTAKATGYHDKRPVLLPLPHQIPKYPDGISFRFAMVHDVLHDRYPRHGKVYYEERNRRTLAAIAKNKDADGMPPPEHFDWIDDLGVGLDSLGASDEAARWLRLKLTAQEKLGLQGKALYTSYANLGTFIIHGNMPKAMQGDDGARKRIREGLQYIHKSIAVNPEAHFGREIWQAVIAEFMLRVSEDRTLLLRYDILGNDFDWKYSYSTPRAVRDLYKTEVAYRVRSYLQHPGDLASAAELRQHITTVGAAGNWAKEVPSSLQESVAFDEPCLGLIGLWRLGGGANPHFALALGETMIRINQRHLAWTAFQRAIREANRFCREEEIRTKLIEHCKGMQGALETWFVEGELKELTERFESELQIGQQYQLAFQKYEEDQIAAGKDIFDTRFYEAFHAQHGSIATPTGQADFLQINEYMPLEYHGPVVFGSGCGALLAATSILLWVKWRRTPRTKRSAATTETRINT